MAGIAGAADGYIKDTTTQTFMKDVVEDRSTSRCWSISGRSGAAPTKQLTPVLEKVVKAAKGKVKLAKMDIDKHPAIPGQLGIQSIPADHCLCERPAGRRIPWVPARKPGSRRSSSG